MEFACVRLLDPRAEQLLSSLHHEYEVRYGPGDAADDVPIEEFDPPVGAFLVLMDGPVTVAGGGIRRFDAETCEVKRMWTHPDYRRQGHAKAVLAQLESMAREMGFLRLRLETGAAQPEALALYSSLDFVEIPNYGRYKSARGFELTLTNP
ncbi:MAG: GNAT family N-acetyltransferase [Leifsonia sp.]